MNACQYMSWQWCVPRYLVTQVKCSLCCLTPYAFGFNLVLFEASWRMVACVRWPNGRGRHYKYTSLSIFTLMLGWQVRNLLYHCLSIIKHHLCIFISRMFASWPANSAISLNQESVGVVLLTHLYITFYWLIWQCFNLYQSNLTFCRFLLSWVITKNSPMILNSFG